MSHIYIYPCGGFHKWGYPTSWTLYISWNIQNGWQHMSHTCIYPYLFAFSSPRIWMKWLVYKGKSHYKMDDDWGYPHDLQKSPWWDPPCHGSRRFATGIPCATGAPPRRWKISWTTHVTWRIRRKPRKDTAKPEELQFHSCGGVHSHGGTPRTLPSSIYRWDFFPCF